MKLASREGVSSDIEWRIAETQIDSSTSAGLIQVFLSKHNCTTQQHGMREVVVSSRVAVCIWSSQTRKTIADGPNPNRLSMMTGPIAGHGDDFFCLVHIMYGPGGAGACVLPALFCACSKPVGGGCGGGGPLMDWCCCCGGRYCGCEWGIAYEEGSGTTGAGWCCGCC